MATEMTTVGRRAAEIGGGIPRGWSTIWYVLRRWPILPGIVLTALVVTAIFAPLISPKDPIATNLRGRTAPPFWYSEWYDEHPNVDRYILGADGTGKDVLSRILHGARVSLMVAMVGLTAGTVSGSILAIIAGYYGGLTDELVTRAVDVWHALPFLLIAILAAMILGQKIWVVMLLLAVAAWSSGVRNVRAEILTLKTRDYILASKVAGASDLRVMFRHLLPNVASTIVVIATLRVGGLILAEAGLSFLGAGIPPPDPTWGNMVADGREFLREAWWIAVFPGVAIFLVVMSFNFVGDWLRDRWDPRLRQVN